MDPRELRALLAWSSVPHVGPRTLSGLLAAAREARGGLADLWEAPLDDVRALVRLDPRGAAALTARSADLLHKAVEDARAVADWGVDVLLAGQPDYPAALTPRAADWPLLFAYGALGLLEEPRAALVSSQSVTPAGLLVTDALADALARRDVGLIASTHREAYQAAATAAKRHAGPSLLVLDRGIATAFPDGLEREPVAASRVWDAAFDPDLQLLLSPFPWRAPWNRSSGRRRDALIFALSQAVVAVDVRAGGTMDTECRAAAARGLPVFALDRGDATPDGTRGLWETGGAERLPWKGAEAACARLLQALPAYEAAEHPADEGWGREVGQFVGRLARLLAPAGTIAAAGDGGRLAAGLRPWLREGERTSGVALLAADLAEAGASPARVTQLLERVARGGHLAVLVPAAWLAASEAGGRAAWLAHAAPRCIVRLPRPVRAREAPEAALLLLQRAGDATRSAPCFEPRRDPMGRFHLRRYLQEVARALVEDR